MVGPGCVQVVLQRVLDGRRAALPAAARARARPLLLLLLLLGHAVERTLERPAALPLCVLDH